MGGKKRTEDEEKSGKGEAKGSLRDHLRITYVYVKSMLGLSLKRPHEEDARDWAIRDGGGEAVERAECKKSRITPEMRKDIRKSQDGVMAAAKRFGVHPNTIRRWRARENVSDLPRYGQIVKRIKKPPSRLEVKR